MREVQNVDEQSAAYNQMRAVIRNPSASPGDRKMIIQMTKEGVSVEEMSNVLNLQTGCVRSLELDARRVLKMPLSEDEIKETNELAARMKASTEGKAYSPKKRMGRPPKAVE